MRRKNLVVIASRLLTLTQDLTLSFKMMHETCFTGNVRHLENLCNITYFKIKYPPKKYVEKNR